jgi:hypothetical protein
MKKEEIKKRASRAGTLCAFTISVFMFLILQVAIFSGCSKDIEPDIDCGCKEVIVRTVAEVCNGGANLCSKETKTAVRDLEGCYTEQEIIKNTVTISKESYRTVKCRRTL